MAMTAAAMAAAIRSRMDAVTYSQTSSSGDANTMSDAFLVALCQGIIDEIIANGVATGSDSNGDSHSLDLA